MTATHDALRALWADAVLRAGGTADAADAAWQELRASYDEAGRRYHTLQHVAEMLVVAAHIDVGLADDERTAVELAMFAHDVVHEGRNGDDERASAAWLRSRLAGCRQAVVERAAALVEVTATHLPSPGDVAAALMCDADLAVLAAAPETYDDYVARLREEYSAVDEAAWRAGRSAVLRSLLDRPQLFHTAPMHGRTADARANITRELASLDF